MLLYKDYILLYIGFDDLKNTLIPKQRNLICVLVIVLQFTTLSYEIGNKKKRIKSYS